jgi:PAS domain S-box-containing protein
MKNLKLIESEELTRAILSTVYDGIVTINSDATVVRFNPAAEKIFGYGQSEVIGQNVNMLMPEPYHSEHNMYIRNYITTGEKKIIGIGREVEGRRKDGTVFPMALAVTEMRVGDKRMFTGILRDITERKKLEEEKADFYAMVTHDLKSPLTTIIGYADLITMSGKADEEVLEMASSILQSSRKLNRMVEDFLVHSKIESGTMKLDLRQVDAAGLLEEARAEFADLAIKNGLTLTVVAEEGLPPLNADKAHMARVLANLVQNAVNYTPEGGSITLRAGRLTEGGRDFITLSVSDTGPGISAEEQARVFEKYYRSQRTAGIKGTGLGLAIVKAVTEAHGGRVELASEECKGSTFNLFLPV